jgi:hypothetical protein
MRLEMIVGKAEIPSHFTVIYPRLIPATNLPQNEHTSLPDGCSETRTSWRYWRISTV